MLLMRGVDKCIALLPPLPFRLSNRAGRLLFVLALLGVPGPDVAVVHGEYLLSKAFKTSHPPTTWTAILSYWHQRRLNTKLSVSRCPPRKAGDNREKRHHLPSARGVNREVK